MEKEMNEVLESIREHAKVVIENKMREVGKNFSETEVNNLLADMVDDLRYGLEETDFFGDE